MSNTIKAKCTRKIRDKQLRIIGYQLVDTYGHTQNITASDLKKAIKK